MTKLIEIVLEIIGWLQIMLGINFIAALLAFGMYCFFPSSSMITAAWIIAAIGAVAGLILATRIWIKHGTVAWLSQIRKVS